MIDGDQELPTIKGGDYIIREWNKLKWASAVH